MSHLRGYQKFKQRAEQVQELIEKLEAWRDEVGGPSERSLHEDYGMLPDELKKLQDVIDGLVDTQNFLERRAKHEAKKHQMQIK